MPKASSTPPPWSVVVRRMLHPERSADLTLTDRRVIDGFLAHMNGDHGDALLAYARGLAGISNAQHAAMTAVDRYGFDLDVTTPEGTRASRLAFDAPASTTDDVRRAMVALAKKARSAGV